MIAEQNPFVGQLTAANARFDDGVRLHAGVHVHFHTSFYRAGEAVRDGQSALPIFWRFGAIHIFEKRFGVTPRKWKRGNLWQRVRLLSGDVFCAGDGSPSGRSRIAGNNVIVRDCATLDVALRAPRTIRKNFAARGTIFCGIGINEQSGGALAFGGERLKAAIAVRI